MEMRSELCRVLVGSPDSWDLVATYSLLFSHVLFPQRFNWGPMLELSWII